MNCYKEIQTDDIILNEKVKQLLSVLDSKKLAHILAIEVPDRPSYFSITPHKKIDQLFGQMGVIIDKVLLSFPKHEREKVKDLVNLYMDSVEDRK